MKSSKIKDIAELKNILKNVKAEGKSIVLANGCFDMLHGGHISYLESAKKLGDILVVAVNSDKSMHIIKGPKRPIFGQNERLEILSAIECIDYLFLFDDRTCDRVLSTLKPHVHAKGTDYTAETVPERETARKFGIRTVIAGNPKENATRNIIELIVARYSDKNEKK